MAVGVPQALKVRMHVGAASQSPAGTVTPWSFQRVPEDPGEGVWGGIGVGLGVCAGPWRRCCPAGSSEMPLPSRGAGHVLQSLVSSQSPGDTACS